MEKLSNKVAIITGAGSGIGKATAKLFASEGAKVIVSDISAEHAGLTVEEIRKSGGEAIVAIADVADAKDTDALVGQAVEAFGTLDILVNNAGIMDNFVPAAEIKDELWEKVFAVNVTGPMRLCRKALSVFLPKGSGVIVNIASIGGLMGSRAGVAYTASKHAVIGLTKNIGFQYAPSGIRCNAIAPGAVSTNIGATITDPDQFGMGRAMVGMNLNPRAGEPEEIAKVALFLASDEASLVNGTVVTADAGWSVY